MFITRLAYVTKQKAFPFFAVAWLIGHGEYRYWPWHPKVVMHLKLVNTGTEP